MKRIGAILVSLVLLLACCSGAFAEENTAAPSEDEETPIVIDGDTILKIRLPGLILLGCGVVCEGSIICNPS